MKIILITNPKSSRGTHELHKLGLLLVAFLLIAVPIALGMLSYQTSQKLDNPQLTKTIAENWKSQLKQEKELLTQLKIKSDSKLQALTVSLAEAQARLIRLEALGEKLIRTGRLNKGEFDFNRRVAQGGLTENIKGDAFTKPTFSQELDNLHSQLEEKELQMLVLESLLDDQLLEQEVFLAGRPIKKGWMSSFYGNRLDPFTGKLARHKGLDFAGKENADIIAVASGVVTWSGDRYGYGLLVEIDHGQGFKTRYAHNKKNLVEVGEIVRKGQTLALMGSTGRSTGPHTHFEVLRNERTVNPEQYVYRENR
jgi:murein DD-endopeptidase MepM/ murein hydrolase activator NlpD